MNRIYRVLVWQAGSAIIFGLAFAIMLTTQTVSDYAQLPHLSTIDGLFSGMITGLYGISIYSGLKTVAFLLVSGATLLAIALAWADRRYGWLLALIVMSVVALLWPSAVESWAFLNSPPPSPLLPPAPVPASIEVAAFTSYAAPLVAVVMALVLALTRRERAAQTPL
ncbi:MAG TPA: hypothetical protein VFN78_07455 [Ktedonobacterales bacterium]|nr:hypothetical protein [Ktedonobacterales bacterium]